MKKHEQKLQSTVLLAVIAFAFIFSPALIMADDGITSSSQLVLQVSTLPEAKINFTQSFTFPFLQGSSPLTSGNNIKADLTAGVSPISADALAQFIWTPIAFIEVSGGGKLGTGWGIPGLGDGIGLNQEVTGGGGPLDLSQINGNPFDGIQWRAFASATFQFDLAAVIPGDWNHILFQAKDELRYSAYTRAGDTDSWIIENDGGENHNGWTNHLTLVLAYQMPLSPILDTIGFMAEGNSNFYNISNQADWGGNLWDWTLSGLFNFNITPQFSTAMIIQMKTKRNYEDRDFQNLHKYWYQDRAIVTDGSAQQSLTFYRVAFMLTYKLK